MVTGPGEAENSAFQVFGIGGRVEAEIELESPCHWWFGVVLDHCVPETLLFTIIHSKSRCPCKIEKKNLWFIPLVKTSYNFL